MGKCNVPTTSIQNGLTSPSPGQTSPAVRLTSRLLIQIAFPPRAPGSPDRPRNHGHTQFPLSADVTLDSLCPHLGRRLLYPMCAKCFASPVCHTLLSRYLAPWILTMSQSYPNGPNAIRVPWHHAHHPHHRNQILHQGWRSRTHVPLIINLPL